MLQWPMHTYPVVLLFCNEEMLYFLDQVCMLNTRLAAAESMTHDVIRDLLGVKLDMTNYAVSSDSYIHK